MDGILKSAPQPETEALKVERKPSNTEAITTVDIPLEPEVYNYFELSPHYQDERIQTIIDWARQDSETTADALVKIKELERNLGMPSTGETRFNKLYNYIKISKRIVELEKLRSVYGQRDIRQEI